jgi:hypothetical protein
MKANVKITQVLKDEKKNLEEMPNKKKQIKITEVETDDEEDDQKQEEPVNVVNNQQRYKANANIESKQINYELSKNVVDFKDKAFKSFSSGQYGDAAENYSKAIENLNKDISLAKSMNSDLQLRLVSLKFNN